MAQGLDVPNDVSVVGYDDVPMAAWYNPPLTTVRQDTAKAGRQLVRKAMRMLQGEEVQPSYLPTDLIIRRSCGACLEESLSPLPRALSIPPWR